MPGHARRTILFAAAALGIMRAIAQQPTTAGSAPQFPPGDTAHAGLVGAAHDTLRSLPQTPPRARNTSFYGSLSSSYAASQNWGGQSLRNFAFVGNMQYRHGLYAGTHGHTHQVMADLGYLKFVDSVWVKSIDRLQINLLWNSTGKKLNQSWSIAFGTQFLPNSFLQYDPELNKSVPRSIGGFLNPFTFEAGYGAVFMFWKTSNINFAVATLRLNSSPKETTPPHFAESNTIEGPKAYYFMTYGFSIAAAINKPFGEHVQWINNTRIFGNGIDRDHANFDFGNMVIVKLWKYLQLRLDTRLAYNPMLNYNIQFRQEVLLGFFYQRNR